MDESCYALRARCRRRRIMASVAMQEYTAPAWGSHKSLVKLQSNCGQIVVKGCAVPCRPGVADGSEGTTDAVAL
jgi:hypothetical protein